MPANEITLELRITTSRPVRDTDESSALGLAIANTLCTIDDDGPIATSAHPGILEADIIDWTEAP